MVFPAAYHRDDALHFSGCFTARQSEQLALRHRIFKRRVASLKPDDKLLMALA